ncbi:hypothetical protein Ga0466249_004341 [Sporomusaceae bacterium BoRhaA]|uniref:hypothetical protein n=1 Tax=Pelorhabdus rhamnosifermentans TaxID=2772457 RepID=UPI001C062F1E|nr:hypothetical protein [Pelorhabdus rhamnosifermentans]MBU2703205.1 hypothetical protein [Pelorhabdus rhamnosifermentans]
MKIWKILLVTLFTVSFSVITAYGSNVTPTLETSVVQITSVAHETQETPPAEPRLIKVQYLENDSRALIPKMEGMQNTALQATINNNLKAAIVPSNFSIEGNFEVSYYGDNLLSIHFWGNMFKPNISQTQIRIDKGIHIDLTTGKIYNLDDLFKPNVDFENRIKDVCLANDTEYRFNHEISTKIWTYKNFASSWAKENESFILLGDSIIVYSVQSELLGGYKIPYSELKDIINTDGELWNKIQGQKIHN